MNKPPMPQIWRIGEKPGAPPFVTWEARPMFQRVCKFLLDHGARTDAYGRTINLNVLDRSVHEIGFNVGQMLQFLRRYHVIWVRPNPPVYEVRFQEPVVTEFLEWSPQELEDSLLAWKKRRELHQQMQAKRKAAES